MAEIQPPVGNGYGRSAAILVLRVIPGEIAGSPQFAGSHLMLPVHSAEQP